MVFMCFSSKDRHTIVEAIVFNLINFGIPIWYDRHKILLGDNRNYKNFVEGVEGSNYAVIVLSTNCINSICANEEIDLIYDKYKNNAMTVFPIFYNIKASELPEKYCWMKTIVYKELTVSDDVRGACNHIVCRFLLDELQKYKIQTISDFLKIENSSDDYTYLKKLSILYLNISTDNINARLTLLYAAIIFIRKSNFPTSIPTFYFKGADRLYSETKLNLTIDLREGLIMERSYLLLLNVTIFGYIV